MYAVSVDFSKVNAELFRSFGVRHSITSAYHPQCNGQAERTNQTVKQALAKYVNDQQNDWDKLVLLLAKSLLSCDIS